MIDLEAVVRAAVAAEVAPLRSELAALRERLAAPPARLEPLEQILGCSSAAARMRAARDRELYALGVQIGPRRRRYDRGAVLGLLRARRGPARDATPRLRAVGGKE